MSLDDWNERAIAKTGAEVLNEMKTVRTVSIQGGRKKYGTETGTKNTDIDKGKYHKVFLIEVNNDT